MTTLTRYQRLLLEVAILSSEPAFPTFPRPTVTDIEPTPQPPNADALRAVPPDLDLRVYGPSFGDILTDLMPDLPDSEPYGIMPWHLRPRVPGDRTTLNERDHKARKRKTKAQRAARRRNR